MFEAAEIHLQTTDGEIALRNLERARRQSWSRFTADPLREGAPESVVQHERLTAQFPGDVQAFGRLEALGARLREVDAASARTALIEAEVALMTRRFADARALLARAALAGAPSIDIDRLRLNIDQARGANLGKVLEQRRQAAARSGRIEDLIALGSLLADLGEFVHADRTYTQALQTYRDVSPFPVAWACFQLGVLWGELVPEPQTALAARWYQKAVDVLPGFTKARVHLAKLHLSGGRAGDAQALLVPSLAIGDPEVHWRLADVLVSQGSHAEAQAQMQSARRGFETLLSWHVLAYADLGAEFYAGSGNDGRRALELARINVANRPTLQAFERAYAIAAAADDTDAASDILAGAAKCWGDSAAFRFSPLAKHCARPSGNGAEILTKPARPRSGG